jgi:hypothetical protein
MRWLHVLGCSMLASLFFAVPVFPAQAQPAPGLPSGPPPSPVRGAADDFELYLQSIVARSTTPYARPTTSPLGEGQPAAPCPT